MTLDTRWLRRALLAGLGLAVSWACADDDYQFVKEKKPASCTNSVEDDNETDVDCGGGKCDPCQTGAKCVIPADCVSESCQNGICAAPTCDDGIINGTETGRDCGGGLCGGCPTGTPCNEPIDCASGVCEGPEGEKKCETSCIAGTAECDGEADVECETNLLTDPMHCGDCSTVCELPHAEQSCVSGRCMIAGCTAPYDNCNGTVDDGCETNLDSSATDCGMCGSECSDLNGTPSCEDSGCQIDCDDGFADCDPDRPGCEQSVDDVLSCGACDRECPSPAGETPFCRDGECGSTPCPDGLGNCDGEGDTCEQDLTSDVANCGRCNGLCTVNHGTPRCDDEVCGVQGCDDDWDNCDTDEDDGGYANGCETHVSEDPMNCGACGRVCPSVNGTASCVGGECRIACNSGWDDCTGGVADGCETNTTADKANCGACARNCDSLFAAPPVNATGQCVNSACEVDACLPNFDDCDSNPDTCESDLRSDEGDCGACGIACQPTGVTSAGNQCVSGTCTPSCDSTHANCDTMGPNGCEINTNTNTAHCGGCNMACTGGRPCISGMCGCSGGLTLCSDACVNTATDGMNCGMCGTVCTGGRTCVSSVCQCPSGLTFCGGVCVDMQTDEANCGVCGRTCDTPAGTLTNTCTAGACVPGCDTLRASCDMEPWDGCETNFSGNTAHCGACNRACQTGTSAHVSANPCSTGGACQPACQAGWSDCDMEPWDGCETDITSVTNCGQCNKDCADTACGSTGSTSCCVQSGSTRNCQAQITFAGIANAVTGGVAGSKLDMSTGTAPLNAIPQHNLQAGTNRMVLLVVAAEKSGEGVSASRPDIVTYGGVTMLAGPEQSGGTGFWSPDLFSYYLTDATGLSGTGNKAIVVDGTPPMPNPSAPGIMIAHLIQLNGVRQTVPIQPFEGIGGDLDTYGPNLPVAVAGSRIYSFAAGLWVSPALSFTVTPAQVGTPPVALTTTQTLSSAELSGHSTLMRMGGVYVSGNSAALLPILASPDPLEYTVSWSAGSTALTTLMFVILPASQ